MFNNFDDLVNETYRSSRQSIEGHYFYDSAKKAWFEIIKASLVFITFEYAFGARWGTGCHRIEAVKRCNKHKSEHLMNCSKSEFNNLIA